MAATRRLGDAHQRGQQLHELDLARQEQGHVRGRHRLHEHEGDDALAVVHEALVLHAPLAHHLEHELVVLGRGLDLLLLAPVVELAHGEEAVHVLGDPHLHGAPAQLRAVTEALLDVLRDHPSHATSGEVSFGNRQKRKA